MDPILGETYSEYLLRISALGGIPYTIQELRDRGWEELPDSKLWTAQIGEPEAPEGEPIPPPEQPTGPELEPLVTIHLWVWCYSPVTASWEGPWSQLFDVAWDALVSEVYAQANNVAKAFCDGQLHDTMGLAPIAGEMTDYDWAIQSPLMYQMSRGI